MRKAGYVGHRETKPLLTQERLSAVASSGCNLSLVLFDEVEKAAPSLTLLMLGILDKGSHNLGDNTVVNFERTLIFLTSNLGAREMSREVTPTLGFSSSDQRTRAQIAGRLETIGLGAVRKRFSPEFVNRIDVVVTSQPLDAEAIARILNHHIDELQRHVHARLGDRWFEIEVSPAARDVLLSRGVSSPVRSARAQADDPPPADATAGRARGVGSDRSRHSRRRRRRRRGHAQPDPGRYPGVDDAPATDGIRRCCSSTTTRRCSAGWKPSWPGAGLEAISVGTAGRAREEVAARRPDLAMLDVVLPDGDGVSLALELRGRDPRLQIVLMTGTELSPEEADLCERHDIPLLRKPFLGQDAIDLIRARMVHHQAARGGSGSPLAPADRS